MKKWISLMMASLCFLLLTACVTTDNPKPAGKRPTEDFIITDYLKDNVVLEEKDTCVISGTSQDGVIIKFELLNKSGKSVLKKQATTDSTTLKWSISFTAPKGSYDSYKIKLSDSYNTYTHTFVNVRFGHVYLLMGDSINDETIIDQTNLEEDDFSDLSFFYVDEKNPHFLDLPSEIDLLDKFTLDFGTSIKKADNMPIGIVVLPFYKTKLYEWLPLENVNTISPIKSYLESKHEYVENPTKLGDMSYLDMILKAHLENLSITSMVLNLGMNDLDDLNEVKSSNVYFQMFYTLIDSLNDNFGDFDLMLLQAPSKEEMNVEKLRHIQSSIANYYSYVKIVPTYDLKVSENGSLDELKLVTRLKDLIKKNKYVSSYSNIILEVDEKLEVVTSIKIEFSNTDKLLVELLSEETVINYFHVFYNAEEEVKELNITPKIEKNYIIIDLTYEEEEINNGETVTIKKVYDKSKINIVYGWLNDLSDVNLFNDDGIPVLPFNIKID